MSKFSEATEALKNGKRVRRDGWPSEKKFIFLQVPAIIPKEVVPKMTSLPDTVKAYFQTTFDDENEQISDIYYFNQTALVGLSNSITGYHPTIEDIMTDDWDILD